MKIVLLFLATLTAVGQSTLTQTWYHPPCKAGDQQGAGITGPDAPKWQDEKTGLWCIHIVQPKKHKAPVKPAWNMDTGAIDDGFAHWQAYSQAPAPIVPNGSGCTDLNNEECLKVITKQPAVPEAIKDGTICDHLPETQKITCLMNLIAPEKAAQDGYDCTMSRTPKTITINCTLKEPK